jgi:hypothetical protein
MAILLNCTTRQRLFLRAEHVFGRSVMADTRLDQADASSLHASIRWTGHAWELRDHSRNGVMINNKMVVTERPTILTIGAIIELCRGGLSSWIVENLAEPTSVLWPSDNGGSVISLSEYNVLPTKAAGELSIYATQSGQWFCEQGRQTRLLRDGDEVRMGEGSWYFRSGTAVQETIDLLPKHGVSAANLMLHFHLSLDEEHVSLQIVGGQHVIDLGERTHHYCLLTLARRRLADARSNFDHAAQGWIELEALAKMLGVDTSHANIQIFRARKQIAQSLPATWAVPDIVERRRGAVRLGHWGARIVRGSVLEDVLLPFGSGLAPKLPL